MFNVINLAYNSLSIGGTKHLVRANWKQLSQLDLCKPLGDSESTNLTNSDMFDLLMLPNEISSLYMRIRWST